MSDTNTVLRDKSLRARQWMNAFYVLSFLCIPGAIGLTLLILELAKQDLRDDLKPDAAFLGLIVGLVLGLVFFLIAKIFETADRRARLITQETVQARVVARRGEWRQLGLTRVHHTVVDVEYDGLKETFLAYWRHDAAVGEEVPVVLAEYRSPVSGKANERYLHRPS